MTSEDFYRLISPITKKIYLLIGRAILTAVNNAEGTQKIQVTALKDETITDIEKLEPYGLTSYPKTGAEVVIAFPNGCRDQGVAIHVHDRRYRPKTLASGEVCLYNHAGVKILLKSNEIHITAGGSLEYAPLVSKVKAIVDDMITKYNAHKHTGVLVGGAVSGVSDTPMVSVAETAYASTEVKIS